MDTELAFYDDFYRTEMEVWVDALVNDERHGPCLVLSATLCHPHGGGQKGDRAELALSAEAAAALGGRSSLVITDTRRADGRILHVLDDQGDPDAIAGAVVGTEPFALGLDWAFRYHQMRLHSAAHLLHCFVERVLGEPVGFPETSDLQPDFGLNRYEKKELLDDAGMERVLSGMNDFTAGNHPISTRPDPERAGFRYWECADWVIPCGGTHPASTREIGQVTAQMSLKRGRTSMTFRVA